MRRASAKKKGKGLGLPLLTRWARGGGFKREVRETESW